MLTGYGACITGLYSVAQAVSWLQRWLARMLCSTRQLAFERTRAAALLAPWVKADRSLLLLQGYTTIRVLAALLSVNQLQLQAPFSLSCCQDAACMTQPLAFILLHYLLFQSCCCDNF